MPIHVPHEAKRRTASDTRVLRRGVAGLCMLALLPMYGAPRAARAETPSTEEGGAPARAVELYQQARDHYRAGRYHQAIVLLEQALELDPDSPDLMYNVARVHELLGNLDAAIVYYRRFLHALPEGEDQERARVEVTLRRLEGARDEVRARTPEADLREPVIIPAKPLGVADGWFWASVAGSAALLGAGGFAGIVALRKEDDVQRFTLGEDGDAAERRKLVSRTHTWAMASDIMLGAGALTAGLAAWLFFGRDPEQPEPVRTVGVGWGSDGAMITWQGAL